MNIVLGRCTTLLCNNIIIQSRIPSSSCFLACFRSTPFSSEKWNNKWSNSSFSDSGGQKPSKTYIKYKTRQRRADAKKALKDLLSRSGSSKFTFEGDFLKRRETKSWEDSFDTTDNKKKRDPQKASARRATKTNQKRNKGKSKKGSIYDDFDDDPGTHFRATFGNRQYSWSFKSWEESFYQSQTSGFEWREGSDRRNKWRTISDEESDEDEDDDQPSVVGSHTDRIALGLPINGPLKIDDVKTAFRLSALKWHPDKHQGPSQAVAEEKFKVCVTAYKSLCSALSN